MWIIPSVPDIETRIVTAELNAIRNMAAKNGKPDPLPSVIRDAVAEIRGDIGACEKNTIGPEGTIPEQLLGTALALIRFRLLNYLPTDALETETRQIEYKSALALLERVSACKFAVEQPEEQGPEIMPTGSGAALVHSTHLHFTRDQTNRL